jgi:hypothetical protein
VERRVEGSEGGVAHRYRAVYDGVAQAKVARRCAVGESSDV